MVGKWIFLLLGLPGTALLQKQSVLREGWFEKDMGEVCILQMLEQFGNGILKARGFWYPTNVHKIHPKALTKEPARLTRK